MKTKSIAMLAMSGLLAASIAYVAPAVAEESSSSMPMEQMLADNSGAGSPMQAPTDDASQGQSGGSASQSDSSSTSNASASSDAAPSNDQGTPDTATGDDDY